MFVLVVRIYVTREHVEKFIAATRDNALASRRESGNRRFDVLQRIDDESAFSLYEVYCSEADFKAHQQTAHYLRWKETVAPWMARPREGERNRAIVPEPWS